jgi:hypothetical protein
MGETGNNTAEEMTGEPTIDYEALALEAMRGVVRTVLQRIAKTGLPGDHHFYISFATDHPGIVLSKRLREKYPREMTIVLQHRFWDLNVSDDRFEVKLTFDGIPERLVIPFASIKVFFDPSVRYGLQFEEHDLGPETGEHAATLAGNGGRTMSTRATTTRKSRAPKKTKSEREPASEPAGSAISSSVPLVPSGKSVPPAVSEEPPANRPKVAETLSADAKPANGGAKIVSLDQFRKK